jgi:hypothetical protein
MAHAEVYELTFQDPGDTGDTVVVRRTEYTGSGGHPVYMDETGIVKAEISDRGEVRMLATGGHQTPARPKARARPPVAGSR